MNAREAALSTLLKTVQSRGYSNIELDAAIKKFGLSGVESSFFTALFYGVIERKITLDFIISRLSSRKWEDIDIKVLTIIEMGIYQLRYMDKVPESAAVNESVKLCERFMAPKNSSAFVNAVLRNYIRSKDTLDITEKKLGKIKYLSILYSVPEWICEMWQSEYGNECEKMLEAFSHAPYMTLRVNTLKTTVDEFLSMLEERGIPAKRGKYASTAVNLRASVSLDMLADLEEYYFVQDEASQLAVLTLGAREGETVIDCCACPGGKSIGTAISMGNRGRIISLDLHKSKLGLITKSAERLGVSIIETSVQNGTEVKEDMPAADKIICDVPCSGLGVIAKKPDIRHKKREEIENLPAIQRKILETNAAYLKSGGDMIYSTCTLSPEENKNVVLDFLASHGEFSLCPFEIGGVKNDGMAELFPHVHKTDGFFIAKLHKN